MAQGGYTVKANPTDADNLSHQNASPAQVMKRQGSTTYAHDRLYRLTQVGAPEGQTTYTYDPTGSRLSRVRCGTTDTYSYDRADRITQVQTVDGQKTVTTAYTVDANGNLIARGKDSFLYDQANRLTKSAVRQPSKYQYNGDGVRTRTNAGQGPFQTHAYDVNLSLPVLLDDGNSNLEVYHRDGLGSVRAVTYANGNVVRGPGSRRWDPGRQDAQARRP